MPGVRSPVQRCAAAKDVPESAHSLQAGTGRSSEQVSVELTHWVVGSLRRPDNKTCMPAAGDPRMDAGADVGARDLEQLLAAGGAPEDLSPAATLAVIDELLTREALWHGGHFLQQTVFSCLYMLQPARQAATDRLVWREATGLLPGAGWRVGRFRHASGASS